MIFKYDQIIDQLVDLIVNGNNISDHIHMKNNIGICSGLFDPRLSDGLFLSKNHVSWKVGNVKIDTYYAQLQSKESIIIYVFYLTQTNESIYWTYQGYINPENFFVDQFNDTLCDLDIEDIDSFFDSNFFE